MRPGRFHPGNSDDCDATEGAIKASMRPGRFHPGNCSQSLYIIIRIIMASMRPGRFHPGNSCILHNDFKAHKLQ